MKIIKIIFILLVLIFIGVVGYQNKDYFMAAQSFNLNLIIVNYHSPQVHTAVLLAACFLIGFFISYFSTLFERFKTNRQVKNLNAAQITLLDTIRMLENEIASLKNRSLESEGNRFSEDQQDETAAPINNNFEESTEDEEPVSGTQQE